MGPGAHAYDNARPALALRRRMCVSAVRYRLSSIELLFIETGLYLGKKAQNRRP